MMEQPFLTPEDAEQLAEIMQRAFNPTATLSEQEQSEIELLKLANKSFDIDGAIHRIADMSQGKVAKDSADVFAAGLLTAFMEQGLVNPQMNRILYLYFKQIAAHWFRTYEHHLKGGEI